MKPEIKNGTQITNAFSVDFEDWYQCLEVVPLSRWGEFESRIERNAHRMFDILDDCEIKATFFVLGFVAENYPHLIKEIANRGHHIGTHGYSHRQVYKINPDEFDEEIKRAVGLVSDLTGQQIYGFRAPIFSIIEQSLWALDILLKHGLRYDSSIYPVWNYRYGIVSNRRYIHELPTPARSKIVEIPIASARYLGRNFPVGGGAYLRILPYLITRMGLKSINREGQPFVFYIHPWEIDPDHPRADVPFRISATHYFNLKSTEKRLRRLGRDFKFASIETVFSDKLGLK
jgi:polysaccharide deacetylase family protein (PEP-CTERM system associated)